MNSEIELKAVVKVEADGPACSAFCIWLKAPEPFCFLFAKDLFLAREDPGGPYILARCPECFNSEQRVISKGIALLETPVSDSASIRRGASGRRVRKDKGLKKGPRKRKGLENIASEPEKEIPRYV